VITRSRCNSQQPALLQRVIAGACDPNKQPVVAEPKALLTMPKIGKRPHFDQRSQSTEGSVSDTRDETSVSAEFGSPDAEQSVISDYDGEGPSNDELMQEAMGNNMDLMLDIIMKIREDPQFAKSVYADCPRLQHMLDQNPQLRPVFEDPRLVRINFEKAYREAGGYLPEDKKPFLARLVNHPLFKFLKFIVFLKKLMGLLQGGGVGILKDLFENFRPDLEHGVGGDHADAGGDGDGDYGDGENQDSKDLNDAADRMEDPEMKEKLDRIKTIEDPEQLAEEIENDPELRALRDSNELCAELMSDPDTMNIMCEPDNLRALGECPDLIDLDMADPDFDPTAEGGGVDVDGGDFETDDNAADADAGADDAAENEGAMEEEEAADAAEEEEIDVIDDLEEDDGFEGDGNLEEPEESGLEDAEEDGLEYAMGEEEMNDKKGGGTQSAGKGAQKKAPQKSRAAQRKKGGNNFVSNIGVGLSEMAAAQLVGVSAGELTGGGNEFDALDAIDDDYAGGMMDELDDLDDELDGLEQAVDDAAETMDDVAEAAEASDLADHAAATAELVTDDDVCNNIDTMNDQLEGVEEAADEAQEKKDAKTAAAAGAGGGAVAGAQAGKEGKSRDVESGAAEAEEGKKPKKSLKFFGNFVANIATAAKEHVATNLLGDDFGEQLVEQMEGDDEEDDGDESDEKKKSKSNDIEKGGKSKR